LKLRRQPKCADCRDGEGRNRTGDTTIFVVDRGASLSISSMPLPDRSLGRGREQVASYRRLVRPGGSLVLEEWDLGSWHFNRPAPAAERLIRSLAEIFADLGGEAGRGLLRTAPRNRYRGARDRRPCDRAQTGHPYLRLPLQFSVALESRLLETLSEDELASLRREAEGELASRADGGTTFTLIQSWGRLEG
jgi:hypothetical protein